MVVIFMGFAPRRWGKGSIVGKFGTIWRWCRNAFRPAGEPIEPRLTGLPRPQRGRLFSHCWERFSTRAGGFVDSGAPPRIICGDHRRPAEETGFLEIGRRRRSNRPGTSQAKGPQVDGTLESGRLGRRLTEGVRRQNRRNLSGPVTEGASTRTEWCGREALWDPMR